MKKMKHFLMLASLFLALVTKSQTNGQKVALNESVSITFPSKPTENVKAKSKTFTCSLPDSTARLNVVVIDLQATNGVDAESLKAAMETDEFWANAKNSMLKTAGANVKIVKEEMVTVQSLKAMHLELEKTYDKGEVNLISILITVQNTTGFNIIFTNRGGKADKALKEQFFNSFEVK